MGLKAQYKPNTGPEKNTHSRACCLVGGGRWAGGFPAHGEAPAKLSRPLSLSRWDNGKFYSAHQKACSEDQRQWKFRVDASLHCSLLSSFFCAPVARLNVLTKFSCRLLLNNWFSLEILGFPPLKKLVVCCLIGTLSLRFVFDRFHASTLQGIDTDVVLCAYDDHFLVSSRFSCSLVRKLCMLLLF